MTSTEIRQSFLDFFRSKQHTIVPSSSLMPDSPNLLFTNAGMNQFVPIFLGQTKCPYTPGRAADTQKCIRAGGKHNDLDEVGLDTYHLTFFEMLGNWSFGQYFKEGAIAYATEFIRDRLQLDWNRIWVSVHAGDPELKLGPDEVAIDLWEKIGMPPERIVPLPSSENFWSVGGPGPCGPDSALYFDWGGATGCGTAR